MRRFVTAIVLCLLLSSCTTFLERFDPGVLIPPAIGAGAGYIAYKETEDESRDTQMLATAAAAGGGMVVSEIIRQMVKDGYDEKFAEGYARGAADTVKRQYWIIQNLQKEEMNNKTTSRKRYYKFPAGGKTDYINHVDYDVTVSIDE